MLPNRNFLQYFPDAELVAQCQAIAAETGAVLEFISDVATAVKGADVIDTDVWVSMGEPESVWEERIHDLSFLVSIKSLQELCDIDRFSKIHHRCTAVAEVVSVFDTCRYYVYRHLVAEL